MSTSNCTKRNFWLDTKNMECKFYGSNNYNLNGRSFVYWLYNAKNSMIFASQGLKSTSFVWLVRLMGLWEISDILLFLLSWGKHQNNFLHNWRIEFWLSWLHTSCRRWQRKEKKEDKKVLRRNENKFGCIITPRVDGFNRGSVLDLFEWERCVARRNDEQ